MRTTLLLSISGLGSEKRIGDGYGLAFAPVDDEPSETSEDVSAAEALAAYNRGEAVPRSSCAANSISIDHGLVTSGCAAEGSS